tara:strand:+ start:9804 stop:10175 length:372 start_codon:yes stop_codon:yes gene_type:complete
MEVNGKVVMITEKNQISEKFAKREIVIETSEDYPQLLSIQFVQDKCEALDSFMEGEDVKIGINLRGRSWESPSGELKYFNTIQGWYIELTDELSMSEDPTPKATKKEFEPVTKTQLAEDDLPF